MTAFHVRSADGTPIAVSAFGAGRAIVVVHGGMDDSRSWTPVAQRLSDRYQVLLMDRRGHGGTCLGASPYQFDREIEDLAAVLDDVSSPQVVIGHSYGALVVLETLLTRPAWPGAAVLYEPPLTIVGPTSEAFGARFERARDSAVDTRAALVDYLRDIAGFRPRAAEAFSALPQATARTKALKSELVAASRLSPDPARYQAIGCPVLLLHGGRSAVRPNRESVLALAAAIPAAGLRELPGEGHFAHRRDPDALAAHIASFLSSFPRAASHD